MITMDLRGYLCEVEFDGETFTARGTNKAWHAALAGQQAKLGDIVLPARQIREITLKTAHAMTNGRLTVAAFSGREFPLNFRRRSNLEFSDLAALLEPIALANRADPPEIEWREQQESRVLKALDDWAGEHAKDPSKDV